MTGIFQSVLLSAVAFILVVGLVVIVHELGHFLAARALGASVERFSIGFGKPLLCWRDRAGVEWRVSALPLGGYVKFAGDDNAASVPDDEHLDALRREIVAREGPGALNRYFHFKPLWQRAIIVAAGPIANFVLAVAIFAGLLWGLGEPTAPARIDAIRPDSPAAHAGFQVGDVVLKADGKRVDSFGGLQMMVVLHTGTPMEFVVRRGDREVPITATPVREAVLDQLGHVQHLGVLGVESHLRPGDVRIRHYGPLQAVGAGAARAWDRVSTTVEYLGRLLTGRETAEQLSGPLGMAQLSGDIAKKTAEAAPDLPTLVANVALAFIELAANISVGIGFLNLLPVPVLDGGHLLFYAFEAVARRPLTAKVQAAGYRVGLALVLGLMLFATWNDLQRLHVLKLFGALFS
jgi:regulator of sigma E protease